jgi:hypothetical protein
MIDSGCVFSVKFSKLEILNFNNNRKNLNLYKSGVINCRFLQ